MRRNGSKTRSFAGGFPVLLFCAAALLLIFSGTPLFAQGRAVIRLAADTIVSGDRIELGDIAEISGAGDEKRRRLESVSLGYAPNVGLMRELFRDRIELSIAAAGFAKTDFAVEAPPKIFVRRAVQTVERERMREAVENAVLANFQSESVSARIVRLDLPENAQVPDGEIEIRAAVPSAGNFFAPFSVSLEIRAAGKTFRRLSATVQIEAEAEILVAAKDLSIGEKLVSVAVRKETRRLEKPLTNYLRDETNLRGLVMLKNLPAGTELTSDAFTAGYVVRAGDPVRITGESGKMRIIVNGEARSSGRIGDRIAVKNLQSGTIVQAVVIDEGSVRVLF